MTPNSPPNCSAAGYPTTIFDYYEDGVANGQLKEVVDPNGVWTGLDYDVWGQLSLYSEGKYDGIIPLKRTSATNAAGFPAKYRWIKDATTSRSLGEYHMAGGVGGSDDNGNPTSSSCLPPLLRPGDIQSPLTTGFPALPCGAPGLPQMCASFGPTDVEYSPKGELLELAMTLKVDGCGATSSNIRTFSNQFNALGLQTNASIVSDESGEEIPRYFSYSYDLAAGTMTRNGPDGVQTYVATDAANRVSFVRRGPESSPIMTATYVYGQTPKLGLVQSITYGNGMVESYLYDDAYRVTELKYTVGAEIVLKLNYTYTNDDLPSAITETGSLSGAGTTTTTFTYDKQRRLVHEVREGNDPFDFSYEYDAGGNRTVKRERDDLEEQVRRTDYHYDLSNPSLYQSKNNRLMLYEVFNTEGQGEELESTTWYDYEDESGLDYGNVTRIVTNIAGTDQYTATRFGYAMNGQTLTYAHGESWTWTGSGCPTDYAIPWAREFRYDGARARYLNRQLDTAQLMLGNFVPAANGDTWTDYDGVVTYGDFSVSGTSVTHLRSYQPGMGQFAWSGNQPDFSTRSYYATDHLGTTRGTTGPTGVPADASMYTAFGDPQAGANPRFGYVGAHGYQAHADMPYLHVGHRYYDSATGRFLQRDPIGVIGGLNGYSYVDASPTNSIDPLGLWRSEMRPDQRELEKKQREETDRIRADRERRQREENRRLNTTPYPYEDMQRTIRRTKQAQWILKVPAHIVSWASLWTPAGWVYKATGTGVSTCSFLVDGYDLFFGP